MTVNDGQQRIGRDEKNACMSTKDDANGWLPPACPPPSFPLFSIPSHRVGLCSSLFAHIPS